MLAEQFASQHFVQESRPSRSTLRRWIESGRIPGRRIGNRFYVDVARFIAGDNDNVYKVLNDVPKTTRPR